jgi:membrane protein DedA with SNARE-associated domain
MDYSGLLHQYGYLLIFLGTFVEGESLLVLGGYFAHRGYLSLGGVMATAFVAAVCGDQLFFHLGRRHAARLFAKFPRLHDKVRVAVHLAERHQTLVVIGMRFLWGLRIALPLAMGMTRMNAVRFFVLNVLSAAAWAALFASIGYSGSHLFSRLVDGFHRFEPWIAGALVATALAVFASRWLSARRPERLP